MSGKNKIRYLAVFKYQGADNGQIKKSKHAAIKFYKTQTDRHQST